MTLKRDLILAKDERLIERLYATLARYQRASKNYEQHKSDANWKKVVLTMEAHEEVVEEIERFRAEVRNRNIHWSFTACA